MIRYSLMRMRYRKIYALLLVTILTIGNVEAQVRINGSVFGGGNAAAVEINTEVNIGGTATIAGNVYGGGNEGDVGKITKSADYNYTWKKTDGTSVNTAGNNKIAGENTNTGVCTVNIYGGTIGTGVEPNNDGTYANGNVYGASKGLADTWWCEKAIVFATNVNVNAGTVRGTVYGGGEVGRVEDDAKVTIGKAGESSEENKANITGNVFGAGAGIKTHGYSALVRGNADVTVQGIAEVGGSVYGGGEIASVGKFTVDKGLPTKPETGGYCTVGVKGNAKIGTSGTTHNVFGACKGVTPAFDSSNDYKNNKSMQTEANRPKNADGTVKAEDVYWNYVDEYEEGYDGTKFVWVYYRTEAEYLAFLKTLALTSHPYVTIAENASVYGSVYGGGERGVTLGHVDVDIIGGTVSKDVYGGGALADTNLGCWDENGGKWSHESKSAWYKTHVSLTGGAIAGDAYGGGLGQKEYGTKGQSGYEPAIEAQVYGDVLVELNGKTTTTNSSTTTTKVADDNKGCIVNRVFGCNNLNGTPKGKVQVYVYATQSATSVNIKTKTRNRDNPENNPYDVQAVYGGGNLAKYEPVDATLIYNETNKATVDAARTEVYIDGCYVTSIKQVYGGGNAAPAPATYVEVLTAYEIDEVFGGGNGYDNYSLKEGAKTVWYENPGANVGYYTYASYPKTGDGAGAGTEGNPWKAVEISKFSGGADNKDNRLSEEDPEAIALRYGSGVATLLVEGGTIHTSYGGSNSKGNVRAKLASTYSSLYPDEDECGMKVGTSYGGGKNAYSDADAEMSADCAKGVEEMFGGTKDADFSGDIDLRISNGSSLKRVFGGNNTSGAVNGSITVTIEEGGCEPIRIQELYLGGFLAPYSVYGYEDETESVSYIDENGDTQSKEQRKPRESGTRLYNDPRINVISATYIGKIFGGGYQAKLVGNPHINVNMERGMIGEDYRSSYTGTPAIDESGHLPIGTIGDIYGGGYMADIVGNTYVEIGTGTWVTSWDDEGNAVYETINPARNAATITGNVFGGGKGVADHFECKKAMIGVDGESEDENKREGGTNVIIANGTVGSLDTDGKLVAGTGNVYGGGEIGRVEKNTVVTIGIGDGEENGTKTPVIRGSVFGGGKGLNTHGYSALVRGNSTVTVQGNAWVQKSVYGGGEISTVGKYTVNSATGLPTTPERGGLCTVTVKGWAEIGPDNMQMTAEGGPDDTGYVFGACKGTLPYDGYEDDEQPYHMDGKKVDGVWTDDPQQYTAFNNLPVEDGVLKVDEKYMKFINTLALATTTEVTIGDHAFIKGSVYGGSENGHVQGNTHVTIQDYCQIGNGDGVNRRYTETEWSNENPSVFKECAQWPYGHKIGGTDENPVMEYLPYDIYKDSDNDGTPDYASDGHTFYGNVFGGGSGYFPYHRNNATALAALRAKNPDYADGLWHYEAGSVGGNTVVDIIGGHILTSVYGGNEQTDVTGTCTINMSDGTVGVPRSVEQMKTHPVTCYVFGAGKGDQRINFDTWTNVASTQVNISGKARIFGSTFGGGEDGHVKGDVETNISKGDNVTVGGKEIEYPYIGSTGTSGVDGNIFGGGRGFSETALTAGVVGGNVYVNIHGGTILGTVFGGGRLASVGTYFVNAESSDYGKMQSGEEHGKITVTIDGGTIGATDSDGKLATSEFSIGDVFGGCKGSSNNNLQFGLAKTTIINMSGGKVNGSVYGGGEVAMVEGNTTIRISGGKVGDGVTEKGGDKIGNVYGGGKGNTGHVKAGLIMGNTNVTISEAESKTTNIYHNVYGGGAYGSVGTFDLSTDDNKATYQVPHAGMPVNWTANTGIANVEIKGGTIGTNGNENGMIFGSSRGDVDYDYTNKLDPNDRLAWVYNTNVIIGDQNDPAKLDAPIIRGSVYGSGENGHTWNNTRIDVNSGTIGVLKETDLGYQLTAGGKTYQGADYPYRGNVYGGGCGTDKYASTKGGSQDTYNPLAGIVRGKTTVNINGGQVAHNVYGAGAMGSVGGSTDEEAGKTIITITGGRIGDDGVDDGNIYGAARGDTDYSGANSNSLAQVRETDVNIQYTTAVTSDNENHTAQLITGSVFGGGEAGVVTGDVAVDMIKGLVLHDVYGGGALANSNTANWDPAANDNAGGWATAHYTAPTESSPAITEYKTNVTLKSGIINGNVYGGGLGRQADDEVEGIPAKVYGDVTVKLNETTASDDCVVKGSVFGCNNLNGSPQNQVTVHVYKTVGYDATHKKSASKDNTTYDLAAVYGGGNLAAYIPVNAKSANAAVKESAFAHVIIDGCGLTSIRQVYGGGNAASAPATKVEVLGTYEIEEVFGGGNGKDALPDGSDNPGANVGFYDYSAVEDTYNTKEERQKTEFVNNYTYGSGVANVNLFGGTIHRVFGGSNTKGNVRQTAVTMLDENSGCDFCVDEAYGGGKSAPMDAEAKLLMACIPGLKAAYGGAEAADIMGGVSLNITNGTFDRVFGGNNIKGTIRGAITVNVEEIGCKPIIIGELYGGGNLAGYSIYGYNNDGSVITSPVAGQTPSASPVVNVKSFTSIGDIYGGGFGTSAVMVGDPCVNINVAEGKFASNETAVILEDKAVKDGAIVAKTETGYPTGSYPIPSHASGKIGAINNVFGGGNAAPVVGNPTVNIGTLQEVEFVTLDKVEGNYQKKTVQGADIRGNVYGGGNKAEVTGNTNVVVGKSSE